MENKEENPQCLLSFSDSESNENSSKKYPAQKCFEAPIEIVA